MGNNTKPRRCWNCGYDLKGLSRDMPCPECGANLLEKPGSTTLRNQAQVAKTWGVAAIVSLWLCFPLAPIASVLAIRTAKQVRSRCAEEGSDPHEVAGHQVGRVLAWVTIGLLASLVAGLTVEFMINGL